MEELIVLKASGEECKVAEDFFSDIFFKEQSIPKSISFISADLRPVYWVIYISGEISAAAATWYENENLHFGRFAVKKEYRSKGIGRILIENVFKAVFEVSDIIYAEARADVTGMILKMGGEVTGKTTHFFDGTITPLILKKDCFYNFLNEKKVDSI